MTMKPPDISQKLQDDLIESLREMGLDDAKIVEFMKRSDEILEGFVQQVDEERAGYCPKCSHSYAAHDTKLEGRGSAMLPEYNPNGYVDLYQCNHYMGMGDWCGCEERSRQPATPEHLRR